MKGDSQMSVSAQLLHKFEELGSELDALRRGWSFDRDKYFVLSVERDVIDALIDDDLKYYGPSDHDLEVMC